MKRIHLQVTDEMLKALDERLLAEGYKDRSEWIREQIRRYLYR